MRIDAVRVEGFRCFSAEGETIDLGELTCLVGPNASGKTSAMMALSRLFGETQAERTIRSGDFYLSPGEELGAKQERRLAVEVKVVFPELEQDEPAGNTIPESFNQMVVDEPNGTPYCRIRLEAEWTADGTATGDIKQSLSWIRTASEDQELIEQNRRPMRAMERSRFRVTYVPAARDPSHQIRSATTSTFGRLLRAIEWAEKRGRIQETLATLSSELGALAGIQTLNKKLQDSWNALYDGRDA